MTLSMPSRSELVGKEASILERLRFEEGIGEWRNAGLRDLSVNIWILMAKAIETRGAVEDK